MDALFNKLYKTFSFSKEKKESLKNFFSKKGDSYSLKDDGILKLLLVFVGPAVLGLLINVLYNVVDRIFVGQFVGAEGLSAVTMVFPITLLQFSFVLLFGSGSGVLIAKSLGENRLDKAEQVFGNMLAGLLIVNVLFTSLGLFFYKDLLVLFGAQDSLLNLSMDYLFIIILGFPLSFFIALEFTCRAEGNPQLPAKLILISSLINVTLDYVFMRIFEMGIRGAALATIIAQGTNVLLLFKYYLSGKSLVKLIWTEIKLKKDIIYAILSVGLAPFLMDSAVSLQNVFANHLLLESGGTDGVAAMGIIFGINVFFMMTSLGIGDGMQPIISYNYGAKRFDRTLKTLEYVLKIVVSVGLIGILIVEIFPIPIIRGFIDDNEAIVSITKVALQIFAMAIPFNMIHIVVTRYFQAIQKNKVATFLAILRPIFLFIPFSYILNDIYGLRGIWISFVVSGFLAAFIALILVKRYSKQKYNS